MSLVTPSTVLKQVSEAVPEDCRHNIVVVGSLAAGYHFYGEDTCVNGLLSSEGVSLGALRAAGLRIVDEAIEPLVEWGNSK